MSNKTDSMQASWDSSYLDAGNAAYLEQMYQQYLQDGTSVPAELSKYFKSIEPVTSAEADHQAIQKYFIQQGKITNKVVVGSTDSERQAQVYRLINAYRTYGHHQATLDPLGLLEIMKHASLDLNYFNLSGCEGEEFCVGDFKGLSGRHKLKDLIAALKQTYSRTIGFEYKHITAFEEVEWLREAIEINQATPHFNSEEKLKILKDLSAADGLEKYLGRKYVGQKRFSLEGGCSLIPLLNEIVYASPDHGVKEIIVGMAHRGRLNVLVNVLGKNPMDLFNEFEGKVIDTKHSGDVKYHLGFSSNIKIKDNNLHLSLAFNPSHLEIVTPVVAGAARAKQRRRGDNSYSAVLPIVMHGDAAFAGQGVVMESLAMSQARGFSVGGTIHVVVNNQVGFTTSNPMDARSSLYCTDVAKMVQAPIFHVNGEDPEAVVFVTQLALNYRMKFKKDVVIDLVCYRRHGHNESDEPSATQPMMYKKIKSRKSESELYAEQLVESGVAAANELKKLSAEYQEALDGGRQVSGASNDIRDYEYSVSWKPFLGNSWRYPAKTSISKKDFERLSHGLLKFPENFVLQAQVKKVMNDREKMASGELSIDWGFAENLAYATLADAGYPIRLCGEDSGRGTFAHRHAVLHNQTDGSTYVPLQNISEKQASVIIIDSILSEEAVLGYEYGFASAEPDNLAIWEAQFGDFANGAQMVIDQFISSGEQKWGRLCGLVMLLPHGYEGMGPEHSSARLERYLQLCAQENMQVCIPTTPSQIFHLLRRQMIRKCRIPLIVMSPKSVLRHKLAVSDISDLTDGEFQLVINEIDDIKPRDVKRVVLCSGKVYYDLLQKRRDENMTDVAILRIEQLYPFPREEVIEALSEYTKAKEVVWCQEEPQNQGAWYSSLHNFKACLGDKQVLTYAGRAPSASPAVGVYAIHVKEQEALVNEALGITNESK